MWIMPAVGMRVIAMRNIERGVMHVMHDVKRLAQRGREGEKAVPAMVLKPC
jgi:hypothetical protein